jgi:hypothetical protein
MTDNLFTPRLQPSNVRLKLYLSSEDMAKVRRGRWSATVTDLITGKVYKAKGAPCDLPRCYCDAIATEVK